MRIWPAAFLIFFLACANAYADDPYDIEIRITNGIWNKPSDMNSQLGNAVSGWPTLPQPQVLGADLIFNISSFLVGLRYETLSARSSTSSNTFLLASGDIATNVQTKLTGNRFAAILGYRYDLDTWAYVDGLATFGLLQNAAFTSSYHDQTTNSDVTGTDTASLGTSYSLGVDGAVKYEFLELGVELGYLNFKATSFKDSSGNTFTAQNSTVTASLSGLYYKLFLGVVF